MMMKMKMEELVKMIWMVGIKMIPSTKNPQNKMKEVVNSQKMVLARKRKRKVKENP